MTRLSSKERKKIFAQLVERDGAACFECEVPLEYYSLCQGIYHTDENIPYSGIIWRRNLDIEHSIPLHRGGSNDLSNQRLRCLPCHKAKTRLERLGIEL